MEHLGIDKLQVGRRQIEQFGKSMSTASLLTSSRPTLPDIAISSECLKPQNQDNRNNETARPASFKGGRAVAVSRVAGSKASPVVAVHGPGSLARQRATRLDIPDAGEVLGMIPSALPRTNSAKLGYYQWKKKHPWSYPWPKLVMKSIIQEKRRVSEELSSRVESLQLENIRLVEEVQETDRHMDTETRNILEKYDQFMTNLSKLKQGYEDRVEQARGALAGRQESMESELRKLEMQVEEKEESVRSSQERLSSLISYQQKEHPLKAIVIYDLKGQVVRLSHSHEEEVWELKRMIEEERERQREEANQEKLKLFQEITDVAVKKAPNDVKWLMRQNQDLREEIKCQEVHIERIRQEVKELESQVSEIKKSRRERERTIDEVEELREDCENNPELYGASLIFPRQYQHVIL